MDPMEQLVRAMNLTSGCVGVEPVVCKDMPDEKKPHESSSEDISMEKDMTFTPKEDSCDQDDTGSSYFDYFDHYVPMPPEDVFWRPFEDKPVELPEELQEKPMTDFPDQQDRYVSNAHPEPLHQESISYNIQEVGDSSGIDVLEKESAQGAESVPIAPDIDYKFCLDTPADCSDVLQEEPATEVPDQHDLQHQGKYVSIPRQESMSEVSTHGIENIAELGGDSSVELLQDDPVGDEISLEDIEESVDQREGTQENSSMKGITNLQTTQGPDTSRVEDHVLSEDVKPNEQVADTQTAVGTSEGKRKFSEEELHKIWDVAKKLCEARRAYNQKVCRPLNRKLPLKKRKPAETLAAYCRRAGRLHTMTNGGVCTIGKGNKSDWEDPPEWHWGQPLPKEICEVIPSKPPPGTPTISLLDDEDCVVSSPTCFEEATSLSPSKRKTPFSISKSLKISGASVFKNLQDTIVVSDSDEELPDFSVELGRYRKTEPCSQESFQMTSDSGSCTVIHSAAPQQCAGKRKAGTVNRAPGGPSRRNPHEVIVLESSDESDAELEVIQVSKKPASDPGLTNKSPKSDPGLTNKSPKSDPAPMADEKQPKTQEWTCPICFETKDKVPYIMSTNCGHIFCGPCLESAIKINKQCPNCRKRVTLQQIHKLYM